ncbi:MAG TPA: hypothetical protein VFT95_17595, partial [Micromonosporaceae bacterium]|nr:hypothetical protein [Micromonosporaceae bacterium]
AVLSAAAVWHVPAARDALAGWVAGLPPRVEVGDLPDQAVVDAWAREHTLGLIERFPLRLEPDTLLVLATALATRVSWQVPFDLAPAADLGAAGPWDGLTRVLRTPGGPQWHRQFVAVTERAGDVAVHTARSHDGLAVTSVVAAPDVPPGEVLAAAYDVAGALATDRRSVRRRSLFDLSDGPRWTITERAAETTAPDGREERCVAVLPAWSAESEHDLTGPGLGFAGAAAVLAGALGLGGHRYEAKQSAMARYSREGFEAAAVTALAVATGFQQPRDGVVREAVLRFNSPYAVVAVTTDPKGGPWHGLPVFSAWVATPTDAS